jgi:beta-galactosidase
VVASEARTVRVAPGATLPSTLRIDVPRPHRWNGRPDPYLYGVAVEVRAGDSADRVQERWGFRTCEVDPARGFLLNGKPYPLHGVCRHQERQDKGNALTEDDHRLDMELVREIGATSVRFAHYQQSDTVYRLCDEMGILAWAEIPFVNQVTGEEWDNARLQLQELIRQSRNHPSIFVWGLHNEVYGKLPTDTAPALTRELNDVAHTEDPTRPTVAVTGAGASVQPVTYIADLQGFNRYYGWYEGADPAKLEGWIERIRKDRPDNCIALTEYGGEGNVHQQSAKVPDPFPDPVKGQFYPEIVQTRLHEVQWSILERHPEIWGTYVWNLVDFTVPLWNRGGEPGRNQKGLVTYDRTVRKDAFHWYRVNWSTVPAVHVADTRIPRNAGEAFDLPIYANREALTVTVDGKDLGGLQRGVNDRQHWLRNVRLAAGDHVIEARVAGDAGGAGASERVVLHVNAGKS